MGLFFQARERVHITAKEGPLYCKCPKTYITNVNIAKCAAVICVSAVKTNIMGTAIFVYGAHRGFFFFYHCYVHLQNAKI